MKNSIIQTLKKAKNIKPDSEWKGITKSRLEELQKISVTNLKEKGRYREFILFIKTFYMRKKLMVAFSFIFLFTTVGGSMALLISKSDNNEISGQRRTEIIQKIVQNNAYSQVRVVLTGNNQKASTLTGQEDQDSVESIIQNKTDFVDKLIITREIIQFGAKQCVGLQPPTLYNNSETTRLTFNGSDASYVSKTINKLEDGRIENYYYSHYIFDGEDAKSKVVEYGGGSYALESTYTFPQDSSFKAIPGSTPETFQELSLEEKFSSMFGPDAKLYEVERDGKKLIAIETSFGVVCDEAKFGETQDYSDPDFWNGEDYDFNIAYNGNSTITMPVNENTDYKAIIVELINPDTFESSGYENYINEISDSSLVFKSIVKESSTQEVNNFAIAIEAAKDSLLNDVKFVTNDTSDQFVIQEEYSNQANINEGIKIFKESSSKLLIPSSEDFGVNIYGQPDLGKMMMNPNGKYYSDRSFYLDGEVGDIQFAEYKKSMESGITTLPAFPNQDNILIQMIDFTGNPSATNNVVKSIRLSSTLYKKDMNDMDIVKASLFSPVIEKSIQEVELLGSLPKAKVYSYKQMNRELLLTEKVDNPENISDFGGEFKQTECIENLCEQSSFIIIQELENTKQAFFFSGLMLNDHEIELDGKTWLGTNPATKDAVFSEELIKTINFRLIDPIIDQDINLLRDLSNKALGFQEQMFTDISQ